MAAFKVKVKWGKETYPDVELDTNEPPEVFRAQVFALTGVQPERQKLLVKGTTLKSESWEGAKLRDGALVVMMGSRDEDMLQEPTQKITFIEDLTEDQTSAALEIPVGIENLGNTCYLNAVMQCIRTISEFHKAIINFDPARDLDRTRFENNPSQGMLLNTISACYHSMDQGMAPRPFFMVELFRKCFPRFAEQSSQGGYMQQDASECWTELLQLFHECLQALKDKPTNSKFRGSLVDQMLSGELESVCTCNEEGGDEPYTSTSTFRQLSCHISTDVKYLHTGLVTRLTESITRNSEKLGRDALFTKKSYITRLPAYLVIEMVRFYYKEKESVNAKILKDVKFPLVLDVMELCSSDLQKRLAPYREHYKDMEEREKEDNRLRKAGKTPDLANRLKLKTVPHYFQDDYGSCNSGFYRLQAVLTHQGRTSSSGHYVAWVRHRDHYWIKCDDDTVTSVTEDEILRLSGGGDWHCAYLLVYGPRPLTVPEDVVIDTTEEVAAGTSVENMQL